MSKDKKHQEIIKKFAIPKISLQKNDFSSGKDEPDTEKPFDRLMRLAREKNPQPPTR